MAEQANTIHQDMDENLMDEASFYRKLRQTSNGLLQGEEEEEEEEDAFLRALRTLDEHVAALRKWNRRVLQDGVGGTALGEQRRKASTPVCCNVLQCVLQCVAVCGSVLQCVAVCGSVWECVTVSCSMLQCVAVCCT